MIKVKIDDNLKVLPRIKSESIDSVITDPPYGISFLNKSWDKALPDKEVWKECLRVLKPGAFIAVMSIPRSDCLWRIMRDLEETGFQINYSSILHLFKMGMPKIYNVGKKSNKEELKGAYTAGSLKPAGEFIIVGMKPIEEKTFQKQAEENQKGILWLDDVRIPHNEKKIVTKRKPMEGQVWNDKTCGYKRGNEQIASPDERGRFPANILVSDKVIDAYKYFDLDEWYKINVLDIPKVSKSEKNKGCEELPCKEGLEKHFETMPDLRMDHKQNRFPNQNFHPTVKPISLMSYLITMFTREGDWVLDPFVGSGTTGIAAMKLKRNAILIENDESYKDIIFARLKYESERK